MEGDDGADWGLKPVTELVGTELEWSTITFASRKLKRKVCSFCSATFTGGPNHIREHIDARITPRHVSTSFSRQPN